MHKSSAGRIKSAVQCSLLAFSSASVAADLEFNKLTACADVARVLAEISRPATSCVAAGTQIERTVRDIVAGTDAKVCVLSAPPVSSLNDFRCFQFLYQGSGSLTCYRQADLAQLESYKANFVSQYSAVTSNYMEAAKRCTGSNGDASRAVPSTFPRTLLHVAEHQIGFNVQYGQTRPGTSMVTHGFARTSPEVAARGPAAIEYVAFATAMMTALSPRTPLGNWELRVDTSDDFAAPFLKMLKRQGLDAYLASVDVSMRRAPLAPKLDKSISLADDLAGLVASRFEDEEFEEMDDDDFELKTGKTKEQAAKEMSTNIAFGARRQMAGRIPGIRLFMRTEGRQCMEDGEGAIGAYIFTLDGETNVQSDFGSVSVIVVGFGDCASWFGSGRDYLKWLAENGKQAILGNLASR